MENPDDRRGAVRHPIMRDGVIACSATRAKQPCVVEDISQTGAKLKVQNVDKVPSDFQLIIESGDFQAACIVVWRSQAEVGVIFEKSNW
ncbi:MAG: PilZ domain-containing protein [Aestuariivirgaceae bacterium]